MGRGGADRFAPIGGLIIAPAAIDDEAATGGAEFKGERGGVSFDAELAAWGLADIKQDRCAAGMGALIAGMRCKSE